MFRCVLQVVRNNRTFRKYFGVLVYFVQQIVNLISDSDSVYFLYIGTYFKDMFRQKKKRTESQKCEQFSYEICVGGYFGDFGSKWSP